MMIATRRELDGSDKRPTVRVRETCRDLHESRSGDFPASHGGRYPRWVSLLIVAVCVGILVLIALAS